MSVTIKDIAEAVGVSNPAVSAVLNNKSGNCRVSETTRKRILEMAAKLGYTPSISAKIMRGMPTKTAAILSCHPFMRLEEHVNSLILELFNKFNRVAFSCFHAVYTENPEENVKITQELISRGVRHFLLIGEPEGARKIETVITGADCRYIQYMGSLERRIVTVMDTAMRQLWQRLSGEEREHFTLLTFDSDVDNSRIAAFRSLFPGVAAEELERKFVVRFPLQPDYGRYYFEGYAMTETLLREKPDTKVIFYHSDHFLLGGVAWLQRHGFRIGEDIRLIGVNHTTAVENHAVPLVSAAFDGEEMAEQLYRNVFDPEPVVHTVPFRLFDNKATQLPQSNRISIHNERPR